MTVQTPVPAPPVRELNGFLRFARLSAVSEDPGQLACYVDAMPDGCVDVDPNDAKPVLKNVSTGRMWVVVSP